MNNISTITGSTQAVHWEILHSANTEPRQTQSAVATAPQDSVVVNSVGGVQPTLIADEDVDAVMDETISMIAHDPYAALHAHSGLDASRVAALLS